MGEMKVAGRAIAGKAVDATLEADHEMRVMSKTGDTRIIWDPGNEDEVKQAKKTFDDLVKKRFRPFKVTGEGKKGEQIKEFDPKAEKLILAPPMAGGEAGRAEG